VRLRAWRELVADNPGHDNRTEIRPRFLFDISVKHGHVALADSETDDLVWPGLGVADSFFNRADAKAAAQRDQSTRARDLLIYRDWIGGERSRRSRVELPISCRRAVRWRLLFSRHRAERRSLTLTGFKKKITPPRDVVCTTVCSVSRMGERLPLRILAPPSAFSATAVIRVVVMLGRDDGQTRQLRGGGFPWKLFAFDDRDGTGYIARAFEFRSPLESRRLC